MARGFARHRAWNRKTQQPKIKQTSQAMAPHDQQTNKPTHHNWSENPPTEISLKTMELAPESALEAALELLGTILASKKPQEPKKHRTQPLLEPPPPPLIPQIEFQNPFKINPESLQQKGYFFWLVFGSCFGAIWCQMGSNLDAKASSKPTQVDSDIDQKWHQNSNDFSDRCLIARGTPFCQFRFEIGRPRGWNKWKTFFWIFLLLRRTCQ